MDGYKREMSEIETFGIELPSLADAEAVDVPGENRTEYFRNGSLVAIRNWNDDGSLEMQTHFKDGEMHGPLATFEENRLASIAFYENGLEHGKSKQFSSDGEVISHYEMNHGTGLDVWWERGILSEERQYVDGKRHGIERWWADQEHVYHEAHFKEGTEHGIVRRWNDDLQLEPGFPKFYVEGEEVGRADYLRLSAQHDDLPAYRDSGDSPKRTPLALLSVEYREFEIDGADEQET